jgi:hypothetical protein
MGTEIQMGPTGAEMAAAGRMLPLTPVESRRSTPVRNPALASSGLDGPGGAGS